MPKLFGKYEVEDVILEITNQRLYYIDLMKSGAEYIKEILKESKNKKEEFVTLRQRLNKESRQFMLISNVMRSLHDMEKSVIQNAR